MAAGTAAALVPIRSITRRVPASSSQSLAASAETKDHPRVSYNKEANEETVSYIADGVEDPGPICTRLLTQLKGIQLGKVEDTFSWRFEVKEEDGKKVVGEKAANGEPQSVDQLD